MIPEDWRGVIRAIIDGHSCLPQESQEIILALIRSGKILAKQYGFEEMLDASQEAHDAIALFEGLEVGE